MRISDWSSDVCSSDLVVMEGWSSSDEAQLGVRGGHVDTARFGLPDCCTLIRYTGSVTHAVRGCGRDTFVSACLVKQVAAAERPMGLAAGDMNCVGPRDSIAQEHTGVCVKLDGPAGQLTQTLRG